jgi:DNA replication protein DnaC
MFDDAAPTLSASLAWLNEPSVCPRCPAESRGGRPCDACATKLSDAWEAIKEREARADRLAAFVATVPESYRWATATDHLEIQLRVRPTDLASVLALPADCAMALLAGRAGAGKTVIATARGRQLVDAGHRVLFVSAPDLAFGMRESRLGQTFDMLERAKRAPVAILDDLGTEPAGLSDAVVDLLFGRHAQSRRTIVTTGLSKSQIATRYGDGVLRRVSEKGRAIVVQIGSQAAGREGST